MTGRTETFRGGIREFGSSTNRRGKPARRLRGQRASSPARRVGARRRREPKRAVKRRAVVPSSSPQSQRKARPPARLAGRPRWTLFRTVPHRNRNLAGVTGTVRSASRSEDVERLEQAEDQSTVTRAIPMPAAAAQVRSGRFVGRRSSRRRFGLAFAWRPCSWPLWASFGTKRAARGRVDRLVTVIPTDAIARRRLAAQDLLNNTRTGSAIR